MPAILGILLLATLLVSPPAHAGESMELASPDASVRAVEAPLALPKSEVPSALPESEVPSALPAAEAPPLPAVRVPSPFATAATDFGGAVAVVGEDVLIGEGGTSFRPGRVYVYRKNAEGAWRVAQELEAPDATPGDAFGSAIATDGERLLVSAPSHSEGRGAAFVFERSGDSWDEAGRLLPLEVEEGDRFGTSVALAGDWAFAGAPRLVGRRGGAIGFRRGTDGSWEEAALLTAPDGEEGDIFGESLAGTEGLLVVGAPARGQGRGAAYVFRLDPSDGSWSAAASLTPTGPDDPSAFGSVLAVQGDRVLVAAPQFGGGAGAVFVFTPDEEDDSEFVLSGRLSGFDSMGGDRFGSALAVHEDAVWVGSPRADSERGALYRFEAGDGGWSGARKVQPGTTPSGAEFGGTVAVGGSVTAVGLSGAENGAGLASILEADAPDGWSDAPLLRPEPDALPAVVDGPVPCSEEGNAEGFACQNVELLAFLPIHEIGGERGIGLNDIWGWQDPDTDRRYALVGRTDGTAFVDVTDPAAPVFVGEMLRTPGSPTSSWRDMKVYRDHAFVVADASGEHGMQVFDLTRLREFDGEPVQWEPDARYDRVNSVHNIVMNDETGFAYAVGSSSGGETCGGGLHMIDVREPTQPTFAGCFSDPETGRASTGATHDAQCVLYRGPDERYREREICFGSNETALSIADVTDKENPVGLARASYPNVAYSHQAWLTDDHRYLYMNDELDVLSGLVDRTRTLIWDVSDLEDPQLAGEYFSPVSASAHNLYIRGDLMYQSNYRSGLRIVDISEPLDPEEVGYLDTAPLEEPEPGFRGSWSNYPFFEDGTIAVSSMREGLFLVRFNPPAAVF